jgi:hypothetical protein
MLDRVERADDKKNRQTPKILKMRLPETSIDKRIQKLGI